MNEFNCLSRQSKFTFDQRQELLKLRAEDKKSVKRVQSMVKRTKSANKSVLEDAIDHNNTAITAAGSVKFRSYEMSI